MKVSKGESSLPKVGLAEQIEESKSAKSKNRQKIRLRKDEDEEVRNNAFFAFFCTFPTPSKQFAISTLINKRRLSVCGLEDHAKNLATSQEAAARDCRGERNGWYI